MYFYQPSQGHGLPHDPLNAIIGPRPIGWISSCDKAGQLNLAPYSFFNCFNYRPPIIGFSSNGWKDSVRNITETEEFVWNLATRDLAEAMNETSATLPHGEDEFTFAGLTPVASQLVRSPRVAESPVNFECRLSQCIQLTGADGTPIDTGWCSAKWWASISLRVCWKRGFTRPRKRSPFCVRVDRQPTTASATAIASIWYARMRAGTISNRLYR